MDFLGCFDSFFIKLDVSKSELSAEAHGIHFEVKIYRNGS